METQVETVTNESTEETVTENPIEDLKKVTQYFGLKDQVNVIEKTRSEMKSYHANYASGDTIDILAAVTENYTEEQLKAMTDSEIEELFELEEGTLKLDLGFEDVVRETEFKRDLLVHLKKEKGINIELDNELEKIDVALKEFEPEFEKIIQEFEDIGLYMRSQLDSERQLESTTPERKDVLNQMISAFDDALTLDRVYDNLLERKLANIIHDYKQRDQLVFNKYMRTIKALGLDTDLTIFPNFETKFLEEKYHAYPNLFLFIVIKHYAYLKNPRRSVDGMFMSRLTLNIKHLFADKMREADRELFLNSVRKILDLFV